MWAIFSWKIYTYTIEVKFIPKPHLYLIKIFSHLSFKVHWTFSAAGTSNQNIFWRGKTETLFFSTKASVTLKKMLKTVEKATPWKSDRRELLSAYWNFFIEKQSFFQLFQDDFWNGPRDKNHQSIWNATAVKNLHTCKTFLYFVQKKFHFIYLKSFKSMA